MEVIEIKICWNSEVLYSGEHENLKEAVEEAVKSGANLRGADLSCASLSCADLSGASLSCASLSCADLSGASLSCADLSCADLSDADLSCASLSGASLSGAQVGKGGDEAMLVGSRPIVQIGPIGSRNDWLTVFWCGDAGVRISAGCQKQISEAHFLKRLAYRHGEGDQANIHAQHYIEALAFAKRLLKDQAEGKL